MSNINTEITTTCDPTKAILFSNSRWHYYFKYKCLLKLNTFIKRLMNIFQFSHNFWLPSIFLSFHHKQQHSHSNGKSNILTLHHYDIQEAIENHYKIMPESNQIICSRHSISKEKSWIERLFLLRTRFGQRSATN